MEPANIDPEQYAKICTAVGAIENLLVGEVVCIVLADRNSNLFLAPRPGDELRVIKALERYPWSLAVRLAEEHT